MSQTISVILLLQFLFVALLLVTLVQIALWLGVYRAVAQHQDRREVVSEWPFVSVVVCVRNDRPNIERLIPAILQQQYAGDWELIVVDDASTDDTAKGLMSFSHPRYTPMILDQKTHLGKKQALAAGIRIAKGSCILVTDADCLPESGVWITEMVRPIALGADLVLGFAPFRKKHGWLIMWQRFEACYTGLQYFAWALRGMPYMGVGRNMAYRKTLFFQANGFDQHFDLASGDDDLFVNAIAQHARVATVMSHDTFMYSDAKENWHPYYKQKTRHFSTSPRYRFWHQMMLSVAGLSHSLHYFFILLLLLAQWGTVFVLLIAVIRIVIIILVFKPVLRRFHEQELQKWLLVFDPLIAVYYTVFVPGIFWNKFNKPRSWT